MAATDPPTVPPRPAASAISAAADEPILALRGVTKRYGTFAAVADVDLTVRPGEVFALLGPNGSGKSTILNVVLGLLRPTAGEVRIMGHPLGGRQQRLALQEVGGLVEGPSFYPYLSGRQNLRLIARLRGVHDEHVERALRTVGMGRRADDPFENYSLGMRQRLGVAAALMHEPHLVILDEPTNGLDPQGTLEMRELIPEIARGGRSVLLASHLLSEVEQVADRVAIIQAGRMIATGEVRELLATGDRLTVEVEPAELERARAILEALPGAQVTSATARRLTVTGDVPPREANAALARAGIYASALETSIRSLEALFLELTEHPGGQVAGRDPVRSGAQP